MIDKLTKEQEAKIPEYVEKYREIGLDTTPCDHAKAEAAIKRAYKYLKLKEPTFVWADSPRAGAIIAARLAKSSDDITTEDLRAQAGSANFGSFEAYWVAFYSYIAHELPVKKDELIDIVEEIVKNCGVYWTFENVVVMTEKPVAVHFDKNGQLDNPDGLALEYKDGTGIFRFNGVRYKSLIDMEINNACVDKK